jgi:hypothetical protein
MQIKQPYDPFPSRLNYISSTNHLLLLVELKKTIHQLACPVPHVGKDIIASEAYSQGLIPRLIPRGGELRRPFPYREAFAFLRFVWTRSTSRKEEWCDCEQLQPKMFVPQQQT